MRQTALFFFLQILAARPATPRRAKKRKVVGDAVKQVRHSSECLSGGETGGEMMSRRVEEEKEKRGERKGTAEAARLVSAQLGNPQRSGEETLVRFEPKLRTGS